jgi:chromosome segregation protein
VRLLSLDLLRYGHLTEVPLRFPEAAGLHVVLGANEAGKSTALAAIGDALFGFPHKSDFAFLHDNATLRIGFALAARDGQRAAFIRRKGRQNTLLDATETAVPEAALQRFLGG